MFNSYDVVLFVAEGNVFDYIRQAEVARTPDQIYALILLEPPHAVPDLKYFDNKVNWTVSYRSEADVQYVYGTVYDKGTHQVVSGVGAKWRDHCSTAVSQFVLDSDIPSIVAGKRKTVAWFVSNCNNVQSRRMELAKEIGKYIPVGIYGACGDLQCSRENGQGCADMLDKDYRFYLSFENAICQDYVTEKVFRTMNSVIIPVVYNGAEMSRVLPPHSYINAEDYATPKALAEYLAILAGNTTEYLKYFWWREYYALGAPSYHCNLCQKLNEWNSNNTIPSYASVEQWYKKGTCRRPKIKFA